MGGREGSRAGSYCGSGDAGRPLSEPRRPGAARSGGREEGLRAGWGRAQRGDWGGLGSHLALLGPQLWARTQTPSESPHPPNPRLDWHSFGGLEETEGLELVPWSTRTRKMTPEEEPGRPGGAVTKRPIAEE